MRHRIRMFLCNVMGWHTASPESFDGVSYGSHCKYCRCRVLKDSQGNWFKVGKP